MLFNKNFIDAVDENPVASIIKACEMAQHKLKALDNGSSWTEEQHEMLWEAASFIQLIIETYDLKFTYALPVVKEQMEHNCPSLKNWIESVKNHFNTKRNENTLKQKIGVFTNRYQSMLKESFSFEFTLGDLRRVRFLIDGLQEKISENRKLDQKYKQRLHDKLEHLQSTLYKKISGLDELWGLIGDAGVLTGKLGADAHPIVENIRELTEIIWQTQVMAEELPSNSKNPILEKKYGQHSVLEVSDTQDKPTDNSTGWTAGLKIPTNY
jgi:hypothetical protein